MTELPADLWRVCESPIERLMAAGFVGLHTSGMAQVRFVLDGRKLEEEIARIHADQKRSPEFCGLWIHVFPQYRVGRYRADFLALVTDNISGNIFADPVLGYCVFDIECDGKNYHQNKRKDQIRNSYFRHERGFKVMRFTGSEIWRDPSRCADKVVQAACDVMCPHGKELDWGTGDWLPWPEEGATMAQARASADVLISAYQFNAREELP